MPRYTHSISDILREDDVRAVFDKADNLREQALISFLWVTGARPSEIAELTINDVIVTLDTITFKLKTKKLKNTEEFQLKERTLEIERPQGMEINIYMETIKQYMDTLPQGIDGVRVFEYSTRWMELVTNRIGLKALGKQLSPYHFRHSAITREAGARRTIDQLMHYKGAKSPRSVSNYLHSTPYMITMKGSEKKEEKKDI